MPLKHYVRQYLAHSLSFRFIEGHFTGGYCPRSLLAWVNVIVLFSWGFDRDVTAQGSLF